MMGVCVALTLLAPAFHVGQHGVDTKFNISVGRTLLPHKA